MKGATEAHSADELWRAAIKELQSQQDNVIASRCGTCREWMNAMLVINNPRNRWVLSRQPALNVPFALAELVWLMRGRQDSAFLNYFNTKLPDYAGTGKSYHGAYGFRLSKAFGFDQLKRAYEALSSNPESRQIVLQIWKAEWDFPRESGEPIAEDIPCNICSFLKVRNGHLHWTQIMRSNDLFLGLPYNLVQFTTLHEIVAGWLNLKIGPYSHYSDSLHLYEDNERHTLKIKNFNIPENTDRLDLNFKDTSEAFCSLGNLVESIIDSTFKATCLVKRLDELEVAVAYKNWAAILVAEGCRRRGDSKSANYSIEKCLNPTLQRGCRRWFSRCGY